MNKDTIEYTEADLIALEEGKRLLAAALDPSIHELVLNEHAAWERFKIQNGELAAHLTDKFWGAGQQIDRCLWEMGTERD